ncbi:AraC family transcriptional regulator [Streptomyces albiflavescens]|uniref:AraC family transcriptional regulator n=2 Tax=Streptomyces albiflavescens TaxID=1623582 RepID=A0A918CZE3_9ACTN|nr:AraC family transcriptional regulator [Streptomyces albiflavescens]
MSELGLLDTSGILRQSWVSPERTSSGLGWEHAYVSTQRERPYHATFEAAPTHLLILHLGGPVTVRRRTGRSMQTERIPAGGFFLHPAGRALDVELQGRLDTVHLYLADSVLQDAHGEGQAVEIAEELGSSDPLIEQLVLALDGVVRRWEPSARTYADHLVGTLAAHLAHAHAAGRPVDRDSASPGLTGQQLTSARELMESRLSEPLPVAEVASVTGLSTSQFTRRFRASTGKSPHQFLLQLRLDHARRLLRTTTVPIADVAVRCGFSHQEHLTRVMRDKLGTTPAVFRRAA